MPSERSTGSDPRRSSGQPKPEGGSAKPSAPKPSSSKKGSRSATEIRQEEWDARVTQMVKSHGGWLTPVLTGLSVTFSTPPTTAATYLAAGLLTLILVSPANWIPHIAAPFVLLIPLQNTLKSISLETKKSKTAAVDSAQWAVFWLVWCLLGRIGSWVAVFRPGWVAMWEVSRALALIIAAGPWLGRAGLRPPPPSAELQAAEKKEAAAAEKAKKDEAKKEDKVAKQDAKDEKAKKEAAAKEAKAAAKAKAEKAARATRP